MKTILYYAFKILIKTQLFFYTKRIKISGKENIPKKGAVLFTANHPNGLLDPLLIASSISRKTNFLVRASVFKNPKIAMFFGWLGMMPVYRMRDGIREVKKNDLIFEKCKDLLNEHKVLLIFPEGSHSRKRTIRPLSKGFTRIVFGALDKDPKMKISVIPVGITYQNSSKYPSEIALKFGKPIIANSYYNVDELHKSTLAIKKEVADALKKLTVHITDDENFDLIEKSLNKLDIDYTDTYKINALIKSSDYNNIGPSKKSKTSFLKYCIIINSILPYFIWKAVSKKVTEVEFVDTFRLGINTILFPLFYGLQSLIITLLLDYKMGSIYFIASLILVILNTKTANSK